MPCLQKPLMEKEHSLSHTYWCVLRPAVKLGASLLGVAYPLKTIFNMLVQTIVQKCVGQGKMQLSHS